jgi:hypothetical protein
MRHDITASPMAFLFFHALPRITPHHAVHVSSNIMSPST